MRNTRTDLLTLTEVARLAGVQQPTLWTWVYSYGFVSEPTVVINNTAFYRTEELDSLIPKIQTLKSGRLLKDLAEARNESITLTTRFIRAGVLPSFDLGNSSYSDTVFEQAKNTKVYTLTEAAKRVGHSRRWLWTLVQNCELEPPDLIVGKRQYYSQQALDRLV